MNVNICYFRVSKGTKQYKQMYGRIYTNIYHVQYLNTVVAVRQSEGSGKSKTGGTELPFYIVMLI
jgi:hypothetical protein